MRAGAAWGTIGVMKIPRRNPRRTSYGVFGSELAGAFAVAAQMALLCPPGFDEWVRRELAGDGRVAPHGVTTPPSAR
jgi:hypothetical protein